MRDEVVDAPEAAAAHPVTPDGRYFVVRERLWRLSDPELESGERERLVARLMNARRAVGAAKMSEDKIAMRKARAEVDASKRLLGERGPVWWNDGAPDYNRHMVRTTPYAVWFEGLGQKG